MNKSRYQRSGPAQDDLITAWAGILLIGAILLGQLWDARNAFVAFDDWWVFFGPSFAGDDYIAATLDAEQVDDLHRYYRSITVLTTVRRMAGSDFELRAPEQLHLLWSLDPAEPGDFENPVFRDTALEVWSAGKLVWVDYDPVVPDEVVESWKRSGWVTDEPWNVSSVQTDEPSTAGGAFVLHTDEGRSTVYVVPLGLSPGTGSGN